MQGIIKTVIIIYFRRGGRGSCARGTLQQGVGQEGAGGQASRTIIEMKYVHCDNDEDGRCRSAQTAEVRNLEDANAARDERGVPSRLFVDNANSRYFILLKYNYPCMP